MCHRRLWVRASVSELVGRGWKGGQNVVVVDMSLEEFEQAVGDALDEVPEDLARMMSNVAVLVEDEHGDRDLLGLYEGIPLTERGEWWAAGSLPDRITIFRHPILRICTSRAQVVEQVRITVVHEIAHHFGIDEDRLRELGWA
jgi:predicted Zn-dependent protease with MMP-like domain